MICNKCDPYREVGMATAPCPLACPCLCHSKEQAELAQPGSISDAMQKERIAEQNIRMFVEAYIQNPSGRNFGQVSDALRAYRIYWVLRRV